MSAIPPQKLPTYVSLSFLFDELGRHSFGQKWDGTEKIAAEIPPLKDARAMIAEEKKLTEKIRKRFDGRSDDEHLARIDFETDLDEYGIWKTDQDEYAIRVIVSQLIQLRKDIRILPYLTDEENYCAKYDAFEKRNVIDKSIKDILLNQKLFAHHRNEKGRQAIPVDCWTSTAVKFDLANNAVFIQGKRFDNLEFEAKQVTKIIREISDKKFSTQTVRDDLMALMRNPSSQDYVKADFRSLIKKKHPSLSGRSFEPIWVEADTMTGGNFRRAGRRPRVRK